jgi:hypothetical protein
VASVIGLDSPLLAVLACLGFSRKNQRKNKKRKTMCINDVRRELHTLVHTQGVDGLLHLYRRLEKRGRALLLCLLCAEAGWLILVNVGLRLERAYLKLRLVLRV